MLLRTFEERFYSRIVGVSKIPIKLLADMPIYLIATYIETFETFSFLFMEIYNKTV